MVAGLVEPRFRSLPAHVSDSQGEKAVEFCRDEAGLVLDEWEERVVRDSLGVDEAGNWAAFEIGVVVPRQNGKGAILEARELAGLFVFGERLVIHSAHQFDTSLEAFLRMEQILEESGLIRELRPRGGVSRSHGSEGFVLRDGRRLRYRTRTKGGGRGFSCDCLILDEAMVLSEFSLGALLPTLSAKPNPQVWYTGSAVDQYVHDQGVVLARLRERGMGGGDPSLAYFEWSVSGDDPEDVGEEVAADPLVWAQANPALGIRISEDYVEKERRSLDNRTFAVERLGVGDWPPTRVVSGVIPIEDWLSLVDVGSRLADSLCLAFDVTPDRAKASIAAAGERPDGLQHVEIIEHKRGTEWVVPRLKELVDRHNPRMVVCNGPAQSLMRAVENEMIPVVDVTAREYVNACAKIVDRVADRTVRHLGTAELTAAIRGAATRSLGDAWAWSRRGSSVDISPLVAATLAVWAIEERQPSIYDQRELVVG